MSLTGPRASQIAAIHLALAVAFGAFGAHGLSNRLDAQALNWWHTATDYWFYHALGLLALGVLIHLWPLQRLEVPFWLLQLGIIMFSGSLYLMAGGGPHWLGAITPIGGTLFIAGWLVLAYRLRQLSTAKIEPLA